MTHVYQTRMIDVGLYGDCGAEIDDVLSRSLTFRSLESAKKSLEDDVRGFEVEMFEDMDDDETRPEMSTFEWEETITMIEWRCEPSGLPWILVVSRTELLD